MACVALVLVRAHTPIYLPRPEASRAGLEVWSALSLIESPGPVEHRDGPREEGERRGGGMERRKEDRLPGWETRSRSIFPCSLSVMSSRSVRFC